MRFIKTYNKYKESIIIDLSINSIDIVESMSVEKDALLSSINAEELDIYNTFNLPIDKYKDSMNIDFLSNNVEFINSLSSIALKKSNILNSSDYECFLNKPCRFMLVYAVESNELENPLYILFQTWNGTLNKWEETKLYKVNDDIKKFYDKLTSKVIEITDGDQSYIYQTSNGNEWTLQNSEKQNDIYLKVFRKDDLQKLLSERKVKITII